MKQLCLSRTLFCILVLLLTQTPHLLATAGNDGPRIGTKPPPLVLREMLQGPALGEVKWENFRDKVVVLEFWNTRCGPCIAAIPHMNELVNQFVNQPVVFISVTDDNPDNAREFLKQKPMAGWVAVDAPVTATRTAYDVRGIPHLLLIDKTGVIAAITHPMKLKAEHIEEILRGKVSSLPPPLPYEADETTDTIRVTEDQQNMVKVSISGPFPKPNGAFNSRGWNEVHSEFRAAKAYIRDAIASFYDIEVNQVASADLLPEGLYDILISVPTNKHDKVQHLFASALETAFDLNLQNRRVERTVYVMRFCATNAPALKPAQRRGGGGGNDGGFVSRGSTMESIASLIAHYLNHPVIDETKSTNLWAAELNWKKSDAERLLSRIYKQLDADIFELLLNFKTSDALAPDVLTSIRDKLGREDFALLSKELLKAKDQRFGPEPFAIVTAAREQLGLELLLTNRVVKVVEIKLKLD